MKDQKNFLDYSVKREIIEIIKQKNHKVKKTKPFGKVMVKVKIYSQIAHFFAVFFKLSHSNIFMTRIKKTNNKL